MGADSNNSKTVTLITGASSGIGRELARKAIAEGHAVILNARRSDPLEELRKSAPDRVFVVAGDVSSNEVQSKLISTAEGLGKIDYLFNNAGFGYYGTLEGQAEENILNMINLNVTALILLTKRALPLLRKSDSGRILNVASVLGRMELPFLSVYCATKYAVVGFSKSLNLELAKTNITCTAICPTGVRTEFASTAAGKEVGSKADKMGEPVDRVVDSIWKERDVHHEVFYPTALAAGSVYLTKLTEPFVKTVLKNRVRKKGLDLLS